MAHTKHHRFSNRTSSSATIPVKSLLPAGVLLFSSITSILASLVAIALRFVSMGSYRQQAGHSENGVFLPAGSEGTRRYLPLYPSSLVNATPGIGFASCLVNFVVSVVVTAGATYLIRRKKPWKLLIPEQVVLLAILTTNILVITGGITYEFASEAASARFDASSWLASDITTRTFTLEGWTCDVGEAYPSILGVEHEFHLQCVMARASRWLWILLWIFAMGMIVGGIYDAKRPRVLIGIRGRGSTTRSEDVEKKTAEGEMPASKTVTRPPRVYRFA